MGCSIHLFKECVNFSNTFTLKRETFAAWNFRGWDLKSAKLKCRQQYFFSSTVELKCRKKVSRRKREIKMPRKTPLKTYLWKKNAMKMHCFLFYFSELDIFFQKQDFDIYIKGKNRPDNLSYPKRGKPWKKLFQNEGKHSWNREILHKVIYVHLHKRKLLSPIPGLFFLLELPSNCC